MVFVGGPDEIAVRSLHLHRLLGHSRQILQMDVDGTPHQTFLRSIDLLGNEVLPKRRKERERNELRKRPDEIPLVASKSP
jgi:hypothetical protein